MSAGSFRIGLKSVVIQKNDDPFDISFPLDSARIKAREERTTHRVRDKRPLSEVQRNIPESTHPSGARSTA